LPEAAAGVVGPPADLPMVLHIQQLLIRPRPVRSGVKVLIVEDSPLVRKMYGLALSPREHELTAAEDGRRALEILADPAQRFDLILLDLRMPDMDGVAFLRQLRRDPRLRRMPVVLTTVEPDGSDLLLEATGLGITAVVKKPWKPQHLRQVVQTAFSEPGT
jgi:two-component system chemotaxis response regulator CheY